MCTVSSTRRSFALHDHCRAYCSNGRARAPVVLHDPEGERGPVPRAPHIAAEGRQAADQLAAAVGHDQQAVVAAVQPVDPPSFVLGRVLEFARLQQHEGGLVGEPAAQRERGGRVVFAGAPHAESAGRDHGRTSARGA